MENKQTSGHVGKSQHDRENFPTKIFDFLRLLPRSLRGIDKGAQSAKKNFHPPSIDRDRERTHILLLLFIVHHTCRWIWRSPSYLLLWRFFVFSRRVADRSVTTKETKTHSDQFQLFKGIYGSDFSTVMKLKITDLIRVKGCWERDFFVSVSRPS